MRNIVNVYEAVDANKTKSILVVFFFMLFVTGVVWVFAQAFGYGLWTVGFALALSGVMSFAGFWYSDRIILSLSGARPASREKDFHFYTVTENLSMAASLPIPKLYVIDDPSPNAFATGRDPNHAVVCATTGLVEKLDRTELEGVVAHELSHVGNYDIRLMSIVAVLAGLVIILSDWFFRISLYGGRGRDRGAHPFILILAFILLLLSPFIATAIKAAVSRRREFLADASAAKLTRFPEGLARALEKIAKDPLPLKEATKATAHLYIDNPLKKHKGDAIGWFGGLFNTHPPTSERIKALRAMT